jgi:hypothetical protein
MRATERIANVNTSDQEERRVRERYPADSYPPADGAPKQDRRTIQEFSQTKGTWAQHPHVGAAPDAPGNANDQQEARPVRKPGTNPKYAEAKNRALQPEEDETPYEDGEQEIDHDRPMDTGTPGGMLGTASHDELTGDPEAESSKMDERLETDER